MNNISSANNLSEEEKSFALEIKFYIDPDINYYEKDKWSLDKPWIYYDYTINFDDI